MKPLLTLALTAAIAAAPLLAIPAHAQAVTDPAVIEQLDQTPTGSIFQRPDCDGADSNDARCLKPGQDGKNHYPSAPSMPQFGI